MNAFKRICLFFFGLAGLAALAALLLPWFGPWTEWAVSMLRVRWYYITMEVCVCITVLGLLISLGRAIFTPRNHKSVVVTRAGDDQITVTTSAISSQAAHIVERSGDFAAEKVWVTASKHTVDVAVRVRPGHAINVVEEGAILHAALVGGLSELAGDTIRSVQIEFVESVSLDAAPDYASYSAPGETGPATGVPAASVQVERAPSEQGESSFEITVPMGHGQAQATPTVAELEQAEAENDEPTSEQASAPVAEPSDEPTDEPSDEGGSELEAGSQPELGSNSAAASETAAQADLTGSDAETAEREEA